MREFVQYMLNSSLYLSTYHLLRSYKVQAVVSSVNNNKLGLSYFMQISCFICKLKISGLHLKKYTLHLWY